MAYPTDILTLANAIGSQFLSVFFGGSVAHSTGINLMLADLKAGLTKLGTGASTASANTVLRGTGSGTTAYGQIVSGDITDGTIVAADISNSAAIAVTQIAAGAANTVLMGGASNAFSASPNVTGSITAQTGLNVGSATAAATGEVKASSHIKAGGTLYPSNQVTYGLVMGAAISVAQSGTTVIGTNVAGILWVYDNTGGDTLVTVCKSGVGVHGTPIQNIGTNFDGSGTDAGAVWSVYRDAGTGAFTIKNRRAAGGSRTVSWALLGG